MAGQQLIPGAGSAGEGIRNVWHGWGQFSGHPTWYAVGENVKNGSALTVGCIVGYGGKDGVIGGNTGFWIGMVDTAGVLGTNGFFSQPDDIWGFKGTMLKVLSDFWLAACNCSCGSVADCIISVVFGNNPLAAAYENKAFINCALDGFCVCVTSLLEFPPVWGFVDTSGSIVSSGIFWQKTFSTCNKFE